MLINGLIDLGHEVALAADSPLAGCERAGHFPISVPTRAALKSQLRRALERFQPEVTHVMSMSAPGLQRIRSVLRGQRWILTIHSVPPYERKLRGWHASDRLHYALRWLRFLPNSTLWRAAMLTHAAPAIIVHSQFVADIVARFGYPRRRIELVPLPMEALVRAPAAAGRAVPVTPLLVTIAGFTHSKGQHDVVRALPAIRERFPGARYQMIGEVRDESYVVFIRSLARSLGVEEAVLMTSGLDGAQIQAVLRDTAVYIQPSHEEGFCLAYLEAAAKVPRLVGARAGAIAEISASDLGARVVPPRDARALAGAVIDVLGVDLPVDLLQRRVTRLQRDFAMAVYLQTHVALYRGAVSPPLPESSSPPY